MAGGAEKLVRKWHEEMKKYTNQKFDERIWGNMKKIWEGLMDKLRRPLDEKIKHLCADDLAADFGVKVNTGEKALCKAIFKLYYYMNGIPIEGKEHEKIGDAVMEENYLRCVVGMVSLHQIFGKHKCFNKYTDYVSSVMSGMRTINNVNDYGTLCRRMNFGKMKIGTKLVGETLAEWNKGKLKEVSEHDWIGYSDKDICKDEEKNRIANPNYEVNEEDKPEWLKEKSVNEMRDIVTKEQYVPVGKVGEVLEKIEKKMKKKKTPYECPGSPSKDGSEEEEDLGIEDWFTYFSNEPTTEDAMKLDEFKTLSLLCDEEEIEDENGDIINLKKHRDFCKIMFKNLLLVTNIKNQHKPGSSQCKGDVKDIPLCDLLNFWAYYMQLFCIPKEVIHYAFKGVEPVGKSLYPHKNYVKCAYDAAPKIHDRDERYMVGEAHELFSRSALYTKMKALTNKTWCEKGKWEYRKNAPEVTNVALAETGLPDQKISTNDQGKNLGKLLKEVESKVKEQKEEEKRKLEELEQVIKQYTPCNERALCDRAQCVTKKWFPSRRRNEYNKSHWGENGGYWGDVKKLLDPLSKAMINGNGAHEKLCENINMGDDASSAASKKACEFIVSGLKHIYIIEKGSPKPPQDAVEDQIFHRTMSCVLLNAFADKLEKMKDEKSCDVKKGIDLAFKDEGSLYKSVCPDGPCKQCKREQNIGDCNIGQGKIGDKLKSMLNKEGKIEQMKQTLEKICPKSTAPPQRSYTKDQPSGPQDATKPVTPGAPPSAEGAGRSAQPPVAPVPNHHETPPSETGKSATPNCDGNKGVDGGPSAAEECLKLIDNDHPAPDNIPQDPDEADANSGPKGVAGSSPGNVNVAKGEAELPSTSVNPAPAAAAPKAEVDTSPPAGAADGSPDAEKSDPGVSSGGPDAVEPTDPDTGASDNNESTSVNPKVEDPDVDAKDPTVDISVPDVEISSSLPGGQSPPSSLGISLSGAGGQGSQTVPKTPKAVPLSNKIHNPSNLLTLYLPLIPVTIAASVTSYLLWKYFALPVKRRRHRRAHEVSGPPSLGEQLLDHVDDQADGPHEYTLVKERKPKSAPTRTKKPKKLGVGRLMIIDIHLEVLNECQKEHLHSTKEDFLKIIVEQFMGSKFIKEGKVPCSDSGFRKKDFVPKEDVPMEQVPSSDSGFRV